MELGKNIFEMVDGVKVRQAQVISSLSKEFQEGKIDEMTMAVRTVASMLKSINGNSDRSTFESFLFDELDPDDFGKLSDAVMEIVNQFVKKKTTTSTNTKPSSVVENETSLKNGEPPSS